eukprot:scaffold349392_cov22-Prasinocladus_malaysianus.AAC.1
MPRVPTIIRAMAQGGKLVLVLAEELRVRFPYSNSYLSGLNQGRGPLNVHTSKCKFRYGTSTGRYVWPYSGTGMSSLPLPLGLRNISV